MVVSGDLGYPELFTTIEALGQRLARTVSPTIYTPDELAQRFARGDAFVKRVLAQPKLWIIGGEDALGLRKPVRPRQAAATRTAGCARVCRAAAVRTGTA